MAPTDEQELSHRALQAARRVACELERDAAGLAADREGLRHAQTAADAARRVVNELESAPTEGMA
jgi:hypothetical protein